jgi:type VI secretion system protein ImpB
MDDFSPAAIAKKVDVLNKLLEARTELSNLLSYMDGKTGAEELIAKVLQDPTVLKTLAASAKPPAQLGKAGDVADKAAS